MQPPDFPLRFKPVYQTYIWGGTKLKTVLNREDAPEGIVAESWEVSDREDGMSVVSGGPLAGAALRDLVREHREAILGSRCDKDVFPLLIKVLDADKTLSVQVHPDDDTAATRGGEPKTEMWYVLEADPGAAVYCGLKPGVTPESFRRGIGENTLESMLEKIHVNAGEAVFVPGGRVHAIASGCLLLEVQQNSNTTYRIYDWGRVGADGEPRELHIEQALRVIRWEDTENALTPTEPMPDLNGVSREKVMESPYFLLERLTLGAPSELPGDPGSFQVLFAIDDRGFHVSAGGERVEVPRGGSVLLPARVASARLEPDDGPIHVMRIRLPE